MAHIERANAEALIPEQVSREIIQETVKGSIALSLGTRMPDMIRKQLKIPVMTGTVSADFVNGDTGLKSTSQMTWDKVYITAEELAVIVPIPEAVLDDSDYDIFGEVRPRIVEAFSAAIDGAVFHGTGKPSTWPDGLVPSAIAAGKYVETTGNLYQDINGEQGVIAKVEESGISVNTYVGALQLRAKLRGAVDTAGQPIFRMAYTSGAAGAMVYELNGTPVAFPENGSLDGTRALLLAGNFNYMRYAIRQDVTYKILDQATITDNEGRVILNLAQQDCVALRAVMRLGWAMPRPVNMISGRDYFPFAVLTPNA
ncbi:MAG: phage major capsid protein [Clostridia bacterium]|nr:phage major capsid protein [Clostridia bacterium]